MNFSIRNLRHGVVLFVIISVALLGFPRGIQSMATPTTMSSSPPQSSSSGADMKFCIGGLGYCGSRLAVRLRQEFPDCKISGCVRSESRKQAWLASNTDNHGVAVHVLDLDNDYTGLDPEGIKDLSEATHMIQTIAPIADFDRDPFLALHSETLLAAASCWKWIGYLSSTGVYGDHNGDWIDENANLNCQDTKSLARVQAEIEWRQFETTRRQQIQATTSSDSKTQMTTTHLPRVDCFRCGGIYGPGRSLLDSTITKVAAGIPLTTNNKEEDGEINKLLPPKYVNRILVDDICGAMIAAIQANTANAAESPPYPPGTIYNLVDDDPAPRREVTAEAVRIVEDARNIASSGGATKKEDPPTGGEAPTTTAGRRRPTSRNTGNKRCQNQRLKDDYQWKLVAPTYREGLQICLESYREVLGRPLPLDLEG